MAGRGGWDDGAAALKSMRSVLYVNNMRAVVVVVEVEVVLVVVAGGGVVEDGRAARASAGLIYPAGEADYGARGMTRPCSPLDHPPVSPWRPVEMCTSPGGPRE